MPDCTNSSPHVNTADFSTRAKRQVVRDLTSDEITPALVGLRSTIRDFYQDKASDGQQRFLLRAIFPLLDAMQKSLRQYHILPSPHDGDEVRR
jgi:hypothetical protein